MILMLDRIAADPNLLMLAVFGGCLLAIGAIVTLWITLFQKNERRMQRRLARVTGTAEPPSTTGPETWTVRSVSTLPWARTARSTSPICSGRAAG